MKNKKATPNQQVVTHQQSISYTGPIPNSSELAKYDQLLPGLADRIMKQAESQTKHRQEIEKKVIESGVLKSKLGLFFGFFIGMTALIGAVICALFDKEIAASFIGVGGLTSLVSVFVIGSQQQKNERLEKERLLQKP